MNRSEMLEITDMLSGAYRFLDFSGEQTFGIWFETLKEFEVGEVRQAVKNWVAYNTEEPRPADIRDATKNVRIAQRQSAEQNWRAIKTVRCPKCNDHGYITVLYPTGYEELRPCDCMAAHEQFSGAFTDEFARKCEQITEATKPFSDGWWKDMKYMFDIKVDDPKREKDIREAWQKKRFRGIKETRGDGSVIVRVTEVVKR